MTAQRAEDSRWRPHLEPWLVHLGLPKGYWLVVDELCRRQGGSRRLVRAGALSLQQATGLNLRYVKQILRNLQAHGLIEVEWSGGGSKNPGGAGLANEVKLGRRGRQEPGTTQLTVRDNGGPGTTLFAPRRGLKKGGLWTILLPTQNGGPGTTPDVPEYDSQRSSTQGDEQKVPAKADNEPDQSGSSPAIEAYLANHRALAERERVREAGGSISAFLATESTEAPVPDLDLPPPRRRR